MSRLPKTSGCLIGLVVSVLVGILLLLNLFVPDIERSVADQMIRWKGPRPALGMGEDPVTICVIDDSTIGKYGKWPLPRSALGELIHKLKDSGASVIAFDMFFSEPHDPDDPVEDKMFADAILEAENVVLGYALRVHSIDPQESADVRCGSGIASVPGQWPEIQRMEGILPNINPLAEAARGRGFLVSPKLFGVYQRGIYQRAWMVLSFDGRHCASLPLVAVKHYLIERARKEKLIGDDVESHQRRVPVLELARNPNGSNPRIVVGTRIASSLSSAESASPSSTLSTTDLRFQREVRINEEGLIGVNYRDHNTFTRHSAVTVIERSPQPHKFKDKIVFIGSSVTGDTQSEIVQTPFGEIPGVVYHATVADNLLRNDYIRDGGYLETLLSFVALFLLGPFVGLSITSRRRALGASVAVLLLVAWPIICFIFFLKLNLYLRVAAPLAAGVLTLLATLPISSSDDPSSPWQIMPRAIARLRRMARRLGERWGLSTRPPIPDQQEEFDVFLCLNEKDVRQVKEIARELEKRGLRPWSDRWQIRPGLLRQREGEEQIKSISAAAVFVGPTGIGPWQEVEQAAFLQQFIERRCPVIPVILQGVEEAPGLPPFLASMKEVNFNDDDTNPWDQLIWGITGSQDPPSRNW